ncbi:MAG: DUF1858 domain-containing protein [Oscillospiraceae bacterium]
MAKFSKDTMIKDVLRDAPQAAPLFQSIGMHCLGCAMASGENIGQACEVHGIDADEFVSKLNKLASE